jgi:hypothetical protein
MNDLSFSVSTANNISKVRWIVQKTCSNKSLVMNRQQSGHVSWICIKATLDDFNGDNITDLVAPV